LRGDSNCEIFNIRDLRLPFIRLYVKVFWIKTKIIIYKLVFINFDITVQINLDEVEYITETTLTIRGARRRITIPKEIVERFGLKNGDKIRWILFRDKTLVLTPSLKE